MVAYIATISVPGYLPARDDPPAFDAPEAAWDHLAARSRDRWPANTRTPTWLRLHRSV